MPPRLAVVAIVLLWLAAAGWFAVRDLAPLWRAGGPPPYTIELADEATHKPLPVLWVLTRNGQPLGRATTKTTYSDADDTFELSLTAAELVLLDAGVMKVVAEKFTDAIRVTREGELRAMHTETALKATSALFGKFTGQATLDAEVQGDQLVRHCRLESKGIGTFEPKLEPVERVRGSVLNPLHPVPRIHGLRLGQRWTQPLVAPHGDILRAALAQVPGGDKAAVLAEQGPKTLDAVVLEGTMPWARQERACFVIEFRGEEFVARVWVDQTDGQVLRQEAESHGEVVRLERE